MIRDSVTSKAMGMMLDSIISNFDDVQLLLQCEPEDQSITKTIATGKLLPNKKLSVGYSASSSDYERPIYQVSIDTPKTFTEWQVREIAEEIAINFPKKTLVYNVEQKIVIETVDISQIMILEKKMSIVISVNLTVVASN